MLFDLRGRGRRRTIQAIYLTLAVLMGAGLVLFGIGGSVSGGLLDAFNGKGGTGGSTIGFEKQIKRAEQRVRASPRNPAAWAALARYQYSQASVGKNYDQSTGRFTSGGKQQLSRAARAWDQYLALNPKSPDDGLARLMVQGFSSSGLNQPAKAAEAAEVVTQTSPSAANFSQLAVYAYQAGETRKGDLAAQRTLDLTPKADRKLMKQRLDQLKKQAATAGQSTGRATPSG